MTVMFGLNGTRQQPTLVEQASTSHPLLCHWYHVNMRMCVHVHVCFCAHVYGWQRETCTCTFVFVFVVLCLCGDCVCVCVCVWHSKQASCTTTGATSPVPSRAAQNLFFYIINYISIQSSITTIQSINHSAIGYSMCLYRIGLHSCIRASRLNSASHAECRRTTGHERPISSTRTNWSTGSANLWWCRFAVYDDGG